MAIGRISGPMLFSNLERQGVDLAFDSNLVYLDVANRRVGITNTSPQYAIDSPGNVKLANILIQGNLITSNAGKVNLGSTSNFTIAGGSANYVLTTDGNGNLSWNEISNLDIQWGNLLLANNTISIANTNGNLNLQANGTGNVVTINDFYAGNVYALNIVGTVSSNGGAFTGNVTAPYFLGNLVANTINANTTTTVTGNTQSWYTTDLNSTNANIATLVATNISTGNAVISGGYITALSNIVAVTGNTQSWYTTDLNSTNANIATLVATNISTGNAVISGGYITALTNAYITTSGITNLSTGNAVISGGYISALSNITVTTGNTESWYATALNSTDGNVTTLVATNFSSANAIITSGNVTANISGNITGTFGSFSGNVDAPWFIGNVAGTIANFLGNVYANANLAVAGNLTVSGNLTALGNVIARQITSPVGDLHISAATNDPNNIIRFDSVSAFDIPAGTSAQRPPSPDYGYVRYNTDIGSIEWWSGAAWVAGQDIIVSETINPDGTNATYTLGQTTSENAILVNINGTIQQAASGAYTVVGDQITFAEIPLITDIIEIRYLAGGVAALTVNFANIASNVSPSANVTYDLGSPNYRWRDLWLSGNTINLGSASLSAVGNTIQLPAGSTVGGASVNVAAINANIQSVNANLVAANAAIITANTAMKTYVDAGLADALFAAGSYGNVVVAEYLYFDPLINSIRANLGTTQIWANANIAAINANLGSYQAFANANIVAIRANLGTTQIWANANIAAINANLSSFYTYANSKIGTNTNSNLVVAAATASTNTTTGALVVSGGVGIGGNLHVGDKLNVNGTSFFNNTQFSYQPAPTSFVGLAGTATLTVAQLLTRIITVTGGGYDLIMPMGTVLDSGLPAGFPVNGAFDFTIIDTDPGGGTLIMSPGVTLVGNDRIDPNSSVTFRLCKIGTATYVVYRLAAG